MNIDAVRRCADKHLVDKMQPGATTVAAIWCDAAQANFESATAILGADANGALILAWAGMHKIAKSLVASCGCRLEDETHGKVADFLACSFESEIGPDDSKLFHALRSDRNSGSYDDPSKANQRLVALGFNLSVTLLPLARSLTLQQR